MFFSWTKRTEPATTGPAPIVLPQSSAEDREEPDVIQPEIGALQKPALIQNGLVKRSLKNIVDQKVRQPKDTYEYKDIAYNKEIRVLKIMHGKEDAPLSCMLCTTVLPSPGYRPSHSEPSNDTRPGFKYWALSYWWGDGVRNNRIEMYNDTGGRGETQTMTDFNISSSIHVRDNLAAALRQFRHEQKDVNIWVDAICINQKNLTEKTAQVSRMDQIYSGADHVRIWLGKSTTETKETFEFLKSILDLQELDKLININKDRKKWMLIVNLMKNPWFGRRWVIQELALAMRASVRWGEEEIQWTNFAEAIALFMTKHDAIKQILGKPNNFEALQDRSSYIIEGQLDPRALGANTLVNATSNLFRRSPDGTIQERLLTLEVLVSSMFLPFEASNPKDTIYAVLSLAKDTFPDGSAPPTPSWMKPIKDPLLAKIVKTISQYWMDVYKRRLFSKLSEPLQNHNGVDHRVATDYGKCLTDVCADFMEYCIENSKSLDILCRHWAPRPEKLTPLEKLETEKSGKKQEQLPSWIPSVEDHAFGGPAGVKDGRRHGDSFVGEPERTHRQHYNASAGLRPYVRFGKYQVIGSRNNTEIKTNFHFQNETPIVKDHDRSALADSKEKLPTPPKKFDGTLYVKGFQLGTIDNPSGRVLRGVIPGEAFKYGGWNIDQDKERTANKVPDQLWRTLVADRGSHGTNAPTWYHRACLECLQYVDPTGDLNTNEIKNLKGAPSTMVMFLERVQQVVWNRRFFLMNSKGRDGKALYGLGPHTAVSGDIVCILFGCSVPVLLRKANLTHGEFYTLVGECYVHGMMDGEALTMRPEHPYSRVNGFVLI
ncbi:Heterokaryon incompatibility protein 6, OR allele [Lachnellula arida]|uniref:Heterokaryon incompatibility protein 6, OR allele n=1 Tax=Lachnellula arida TaxID=1316785 RepID=A0A8T9BD58_9HELO|nr:Heterokaryon incompatibility protein 6, OR allele [Lachnellula arida]